MTLEDAQPDVQKRCFEKAKYLLERGYCKGSIEEIAERIFKSEKQESINKEE